jgi:hypothetical protein
MQLNCRHRLRNDRHSWLKHCALLRLVVPGALVTISLLSAALPRILSQDIPVESCLGTVLGTPANASTAVPAGTTTTTATTTSTGPNDGDANAPGVTGVFNGNITTGCSYDPLTRNAKRVVTDMVVPGCVSAYPLKMTRYYNSRQPFGPVWQHDYSYYLSKAGAQVNCPNGNTYDYSCSRPPGVSERWDPNPNIPPKTNFRLADGGTVVFNPTNLTATAIIDPYGQVTTITRTNGYVSRVTEPLSSELLRLLAVREQEISHHLPVSELMLSHLTQV